MPLVLCHNSGIQTGGAPMSTLHGECPPDCVMFVFGDDAHRRPCIPWVRQPDFQLETLKQIATATIQGCEERLLAGLTCATDHKSLAKDHGSVDRSMKDRGAQERSQKVDRSSSITRPRQKTAIHLFLPGEIGLSHWKLPKVRGIVRGCHCLTYSGANPGASEVAVCISNAVQNLTVQTNTRYGTVGGGKKVLKNVASASGRSSFFSAGGARKALKKMSSNMASSSFRSTSLRSSMSDRTRSSRFQPLPNLLGVGGTPEEAFLLLLSTQTFVGEDGARLADEVRRVLSDGVPILLVHVVEGEPDGCEFDRFFETSESSGPDPHHSLNLAAMPDRGGCAYRVTAPSDLVAAGLYRPIALQWFKRSGFNSVSVALIGQWLGARRTTSKQDGDDTKSRLKGSVSKLRARVSFVAVPSLKSSNSNA